MGLFVGWFFLAAVVGAIGANRKIGFAGAFFLSLILSPLIGIVITLFSATAEEEQYKKDLLEATKGISEVKTDGKNSTHEIEQLYNLYQKGILTEEEYITKKAKILEN